MFERQYVECHASCQSKASVSSAARSGSTQPITFNVIDASITGLDFTLTKTPAPVSGETPAASGGARTLAETGIAASGQVELALFLVIAGGARLAIGRRRRTE